MNYCCCMQQIELNLNYNRLPSSRNFDILFRLIDSIERDFGLVWRLLIINSSVISVVKCLFLTKIVFGRIIAGKTFDSAKYRWKDMICGTSISVYQIFLFSYQPQQHSVTSSAHCKWTLCKFESVAEIIERTSQRRHVIFTCIERAHISTVIFTQSIFILSFSRIFDIALWFAVLVNLSLIQLSKYDHIKTV